MRPVRVLLVLLALGVACATGSLWFDAWHRVEGSSLELTGDPSRVYSAPTHLEVGDPLGRDELVALFEALDAHPSIAGDRVTARVQDRAFEVTVAAGAVRSLSVDGASRDSIELPPVLLATWLGPAMIEHRRVALTDVPPQIENCSILQLHRTRDRAWRIACVNDATHLAELRTATDEG